MPKSVIFYNEGVKLAGDCSCRRTSSPTSGGRRACRGYTGGQRARPGDDAGYVVLTFMGAQPRWDVARLGIYDTSCEIRQLPRLSQRGPMQEELIAAVMRLIFNRAKGS